MFGPSAGYRPAQTARRTNASSHCLSAAMVYPHQALAAYVNLLSITNYMLYNGRLPEKTMFIELATCRKHTVQNY